MRVSEYIKSLNSLAEFRFYQIIYNFKPLLTWSFNLHLWVEIGHFLCQRNRFRIKHVLITPIQDENKAFLDRLDSIINYRIVVQAIDIHSLAASSITPGYHENYHVIAVS